MFNPRKYLESLTVKPGVHLLVLDRIVEQIDPQGETRFRLEFVLKDDESKQITDFIVPSNPLSMQRAFALARLVDPKLLDTDFTSKEEFLRTLFAKLKEGAVVKAVVSLVSKADGSVVNRVRSYVEIGSELVPRQRDNEVPF